MTLLIILAAKYLIFIIALGAAAAVGVAVRGGRRELLWVLGVALPLGYALARLAGLFFAHQQPFALEGFTPLIPHDVDNAFPSDHTVIAGVFASVAFLADKRVGIALWVLTLLVGAARVSAGLHYPIDILAAALLALLATLAAWGVVKATKGVY
ncbi:phosphatase PAP2 family protein [Candidatus Kaiserbacteria bacterium]|nr:phosphatase PAP2 family protein [Candidatus Kaiserbacteria bacterium]